MTTAVGLAVKFLADDKAVTSSFNKIQQGYNNMSSGAHRMSNTIKSALGALGITLSVYGFTKWLTSTADAIDELTDKARGLGIVAEAFQKLSYSASMSGVSMDQVEGSLRKMNLNIGKAIEGNKEVNQTFEKLGVTLNDLKGKDLDKQFLLITEALGKITDKNLQASYAASIFGKSYTDVLNLVRDNINKTAADFDKLGISLTDAQRKAVDSFNDSRTKLEALWSGLSQKIVAYVSPAFEKILSFINNYITQMGGIDSVAQSFANGIITAIDSIMVAFGFLINTIQEVKKGMLFISSLSLGFSALQNRNAKSNQFTYDPNNDDLYKEGKMIEQLQKENYSSFNSVESNQNGWNNWITQRRRGLDRSRPTTSAATYNESLQNVPSSFMWGSNISANSVLNGQKSKVDITVKADAGFKVEVATSSEMVQQIEKQIIDTAKRANSIGSR